MVKDPRAAARAGQLRSLNQPRPITVLVEHGRPAVLDDGRQRYRVARIRDTWRVDDEWWRDPISRRYYDLILDNGGRRTVYHDLVTGDWYAQSY